MRVLAVYSDQCEDIVTYFYHKLDYFYYAICYNAKSYKNAAITF